MPYNRDKRKSEGLCMRCQNFAFPGMTYCITCLDKYKHRMILKRLKSSSENTCRKCDKPKLETANYCLLCWARLISASATGTYQNYDLLLRKLEHQNYRCYYSDKILIPGINASVDHKNPKSKGGTNELSNLVWCDLSVNYMKRELTTNQFLTFCRNIHLNTLNNPDHPDYISRNSSKYQLWFDFDYD